ILTGGGRAPVSSPYSSNRGGSLPRSRGSPCSDERSCAGWLSSFDAHRLLLEQLYCLVGILVVAGWSLRSLGSGWGSGRLGHRASPRCLGRCRPLPAFAGVAERPLSAAPSRRLPARAY